MEGDICAVEREIGSVGFAMENAPRLGGRLEGLEHRRGGVRGDDEHEVVDQVLPPPQ